jgi:hypothetical protein
MSTQTLITQLMDGKKKSQLVLDRSICTLIGALPFKIAEQKPGLFPISMYRMDAAKENEIKTLIVQEGFYFRYVGDGKHIEQYEKAEVIANAIVNDYCNAQLGVDTSHDEPELNARPALIWVYGAHEMKDAVDLFQGEIILARQQQINWFKRLVAIADDDWNKYRQHKMISDLQRFAAQHLGYKSDWTNIQSIMSQPVTCPACRSLISDEALICNICRTVIKPNEYAKMGYKQANL